MSRHVAAAGCVWPLDCEWLLCDAYLIGGSVRGNRHELPSFRDDPLGTAIWLVPCRVVTPIRSLGVELVSATNSVSYIDHPAGLDRHCGVLRPTVWRIAMHERLSALIEAGAGFHHDLHGGKTFTSAALFIMGMRCEEIRRKFDVIVEFSGLADFTDCAAVLSSLGALTILPSP